MPVFTDQTGNQISLTAVPKRIISLVPSQTELLYDLGLDGEVVGITKFCIHPNEWFQNKTKVGGTKQLKLELIRQLQPDLIIANKEENVKEQIEELQKQFPVWTSDVNDLRSAYDMIEQVGLLTGKKKAANDLCVRISKNFNQLQTSNLSAGQAGNKPQTIYLIWQNPYMTVGGDTFIHSMMDAAGFHNLLGDQKRYPIVTIAELQSLNPEFLLLSSEPFPFKQEHVDELQQLLPNTRIILVDGELFSWYGSRLLQAPAYFSSLRAAIS